MRENEKERDRDVLLGVKQVCWSNAGEMKCTTLCRSVERRKGGEIRLVHLPYCEDNKGKTSWDMS